MTWLVLTALAVTLSGATWQTPPPVPVYIGPVPSPEGFVTPPGHLEDSYGDLRKEFEKRREFRQVITLLDTPEAAAILLEVIDRGIVDTGFRTGNTVATGPTTAVTTSHPVRAKQLYARFVVRGTEYQQVVDGAKGVRLKSYRNQVENVLKQLVEWVKANRTKLAQ